jgi:hypothetical protein
MFLIAVAYVVQLCKTLQRPQIEEVEHEEEKNKGAVVPLHTSETPSPSDQERLVLCYALGFSSGLNVDERRLSSPLILCSTPIKKQRRSHSFDNGRVVKSAVHLFDHHGGVCSEIKTLYHLRLSCFTWIFCCIIRYLSCSNISFQMMFLWTMLAISSIRL